MKSKIHAISVEPSANGTNRFVVNLNTVAGHVFFSASLAKPEAVRIARSQLRSALPALMTVNDPMHHMLTNRSKFIGQELDIEVVPQMKDGQPVVNPNTGEPYTNVRLIPDSSDLSPEVASQLLGAVAATAAVADLPEA